MTPGFKETPAKKEKAEEGDSRVDMSIVETCSLDDPSHQLSYKDSVSYSEDLLQRTLDKAEKKAGENANPEEVRVAKIKAIEKDIEEIENNHAEAEPGEAKEKFCYRLLHVFANKRDELKDQKNEPKVKRIANQSRSDQSVKSKSRR